MSITEIIGCIIGTLGILSIIVLDFLAFRAITRTPGRRERASEKEKAEQEKEAALRRRQELNFYRYDGTDQRNQADE